jgi:hypothetical protein
MHRLGRVEEMARRARAAQGSGKLPRNVTRLTDAAGEHRPRAVQHEPDGPVEVVVERGDQPAQRANLRRDHLLREFADLTAHASGA